MKVKRIICPSTIDTRAISKKVCIVNEQNLVIEKFLGCIQEKLIPYFLKI